MVGDSPFFKKLKKVSETCSSIYLRLKKLNSRKTTSNRLTTTKTCNNVFISASLKLSSCIVHKSIAAMIPMIIISRIDTLQHTRNDCFIVFVFEPSRTINNLLAKLRTKIMKLRTAIKLIFSLGLHLS